MPLSRQYLVTAICRALSLSGMDTAQFHSHSFCIGAATMAAQVGLPDSTIQLLGRWRSSVFTRHLRPSVPSLAVVSGRLAQPAGSLIDQSSLHVTRLILSCNLNCIVLIFYLVIASYLLLRFTLYYLLHDFVLFKLFTN